MGGMSPARRSTLALTVLALLQYKPLHPYGIQQLIKQWGKDQVVNVSQRTSLYRVIERLHDAGLIQVLETARDHAYPERTVYEITDAGRAMARAWMLEMLAQPEQGFPEFPAALSHLLMLTRQEMLDALDRRSSALAAALERYDITLAQQREHQLPRITALETEYLRAVTAAEAQWVRSITDDLRAGQLTWSAEALTALADALERSS
jgi:DNA-binding PadR family transcriptional regulator